MWITPACCHSSQGSVASSLPADSCGPLPAAWVTLSGTPTLRPSSWRGWKTRPWSERLFTSATFATWTEASCAAGLTSSPPDSRAPRCQQPANGLVRLTVDGSGPKSSVSSEKSSRGSSSSKTYLGSSLDPEPELAAYVAGLLDGEGCISITGRGGGFWPSVGLEMTLSARQAISTIKSIFGGTLQIRKRDNPNAAVTVTLEWRSHSATEPLLLAILPFLRVKREQAVIVLGMIEYDRNNPTPKVGSGMAWTTERLAAWATAKERIHKLNSRGPQQPPPDYVAERVGNRWIRRRVDLFGERWETFSGPWPHSGSLRNGVVYELPTWVPRTGGTVGSVWHTPDLGSGKSTRGATAEAYGLQTDAEMWPTPRSQEPGATNIGYGRGLAELAEGKTQRWPTATSRDSKDGACADADVPTNALLGRLCEKGLLQASELFHRGQETSTHGEPSSPSNRGSRRRLNPAFVEWLMGFPDLWTYPEPTGSDASEMRSYLSKQRRLLENF